MPEPERVEPERVERERPMLRPERFVAGGEALAHDDDGRIVFVRGGIPGDEVTVETIERKSDWSRAVVDEVCSPSIDRVDAPCRRRRQGCGGCDWQEVAIAAQLPAKVDIVTDAFRRTARLHDPDVRAGSSVPAVAYRTTVRVVGGPDGRPSYRMERSHQTVPADGCLIAHPSLLDLLDVIEVPSGLEVSLRTSVSTGERTAWWDRRRGQVAGLPDDVAVGARATLVEHVAGHPFRVSAGSFFQSGPAAAELLVEAVRRAAPELVGAGTVLDAYAGVGLFAVAASDHASSVIALEGSRTAVDDARHNLAGRSASIELGQVGRWRRAAKARIDVMIADPARSGLGRPGVAAAVSADAPVLVLVSCDPVAAARDAALLARHGYRHDGTEVLDLFPHTHHVECVTRFVRAH